MQPFRNSVVVNKRNKIKHNRRSKCKNKMIKYHIWNWTYKKTHLLLKIKWIWMDLSTKRILQCRQVNWVSASLGLKRSTMTHLWMKKIRLIFLNQILQMRLNQLPSAEEIMIITQKLFQINIWTYRWKTLMHLKVMVYHMLPESANQLLLWKIQ